MAQWVGPDIVSMEMCVQSLALLSELRISVAPHYGIGHRCGWDPALLWLWHRLEATAPIRPLAWEPLYATGAALEKAKRQKKKKLTIELPQDSISVLVF